jgi:hypothetical protein
MDIFISYRRDDSAGHAGRLFDGLRDSLGAEHVFMDVSDLRPGQDFVVELDRAVAQADCVLAVIGPRWLDAVDQSGRRRIDDPQDLVRREISAGLAKGASVIPVLVHGAAMPRADALPQTLRPLARRQAIEISDTRWDNDLRELVRSLSAGARVATASRVTAPAAKDLSKSSMRRFGALALIASILLSGALWLVFAPAGRKTEILESRPDASTRGATGDGAATAAAVGPGPDKLAGRQQRFAIALPQVSEVRFRTHRAQVAFRLMGIRQESRDSSSQVLTVLVRMLNHGPADEAFGSDQFRLIAGDQEIAPTGSLISSTEAMEAKEASLSFIAPSGVVDVALQVRVNGERTRIPIALSDRSAIRDDASLDDFGQVRPARIVDTLARFPAALAVGQVVEVGKVSYQLSAAVIERQTVEKASLSVTVRCTAPVGGGGVSFGSSTVRLWIDGVPRAPVNTVNVAVDPGDTREASFVFDLLSMPQALEVGVVNGSDSVKVPLSLASLPRR